MAEDQAKRFKEIKNILIVILVLNWGVAGAKIIYGLINGYLGITNF